MKPGIRCVCSPCLLSFWGLFQPPRVTGGLLRPLACSGASGGHSGNSEFRGTAVGRLPGGLSSGSDKTTCAQQPLAHTQLTFLSVLIAPDLETSRTVSALLHAPPFGRLQPRPQVQSLLQGDLTPFSLQPCFLGVGPARCNQTEFQGCSLS